MALCAGSPNMSDLHGAASPRPPARLARLLLPLAFGITIGLVYGWVIQPAEYVDVSPIILRADYRADYVLMVAEAHVAQQDSALAAQRVALLGPEPPSQIVLDAIAEGQSLHFAPHDQAILQNLLADMQLVRSEGG
jgi:hypothetical protein